LLVFRGKEIIHALRNIDSFQSKVKIPFNDISLECYEQPEKHREWIQKLRNEHATYTEIFLGSPDNPNGIYSLVEKKLSLDENERTNAAMVTVFLLACGGPMRFFDEPCCCPTLLVFVHTIPQSASLLSLFAPFSTALVVAIFKQWRALDTWSFADLAFLVTCLQNGFQLPVMNNLTSLGTISLYYLLGPPIKIFYSLLAYRE
jgi:hypothetical protein